MRIKGFDNPLDSEVLRAVLFHYETEYEATLARFVERIRHNTDTLDEAIALHEYVDSFVETLSTVAQDMMAQEDYDIFTTNTQAFIDSAQEEIHACLSRWESHIEDEADDLRYREPEPRPVPDRLSFGMFADVDE